MQVSACIITDLLVSAFVTASSATPGNFGPAGNFAVVAPGASVFGLPDDFSPLGGICEAAPAMDPRLLETTCMNRSKYMERPLEYHRCAAATTTSSSSETILPSIQQYLFCGHGGTMEEITKGLHICLFALQVGCFSKLPSGSF
ncbi:uncharacterized protein LOC142804291 [Rhipicephalus microplus]|uniref:uncharacterized protein LOC142804291 n=1 Tax=Rhipicephalus microplus TaxID=6941 RepID=UPI003F6B0C82